MVRKVHYEDSCGTAHALDLVGERWSLLVVRELLLGPKRYSDLESALSGVSSNVLARRLRDLEEVGVVARRRLGSPVRAWVYELTDWGRELQSVIVELGRWGRTSPLRDKSYGTSIDALVIALLSHSTTGTGEHLALTIDGDCFLVTANPAGWQIARGTPRDEDATIELDAKTFEELLAGRTGLNEAAEDGRATITGDRSLLERLFKATDDKPSESS